MPPKTEKSGDEIIPACVSQLKEMFEAEFAKLHEHKSEPHATPPIIPKTPKPRLSPFDGSNPLDWLFQAEQFFELTQTPITQRLRYIPFYMQGTALTWFKWMHANNQLNSWPISPLH